MAFTTVANFFPPNIGNYVFLAIEGIFWIMCVLKLFSEVRWLCMKGIGRWLASVWHVFDLANGLTLTAIFFMRFFLMLFISDLNFNPTSSEFTDFYATGNLLFLIQNLFSVSVILSNYI